METQPRGLRYRLSIPNFLAMRTMGHILPRFVASGRIPGLELGAWGSISLPGPDWLRIRPRLSGICGSDMGLLTAKSSPALSPFTSFPSILGHETVADVAEIGNDVHGVSIGDRVVVDPYISCEMRGLNPCPGCASGQRCLCINTAEGTLAPGMLIGFCRDLPGAWGEEMVVHRSQLYPVPEEVSDNAAVLVEPFSIGLHAVLQRPPKDNHRVLILGAGPVGLLTLAAIRLLDIQCHVTVVAKYPNQAEMAEKLGADEVRRDARTAVTEIIGATEYRPLRGGAVYTGGFDQVYDCVGSGSSLDQSLRVTGPGGAIIAVGCVGEVSRVDLTFIWARELDLVGTYGYATEPGLEGSPHTFEVALNLLKENTDVPLADLVTHQFALPEWREAIKVNLSRGNAGTIKTVFDLSL